jgi:hypothetical protein
LIAKALSGGLDRAQILMAGEPWREIRVSLRAAWERSCTLSPSYKGDKAAKLPIFKFRRFLRLAEILFAIRIRED